MKLIENQPAPEFNLPDETGKMHSLADYKGKTVILYFYPKDDTPGCTTEACSLRDNYSAFLKAGVTILGVSADNVKSHQKFKEKYHLPFPLLADEGHKVCDAYGTWGLKKTLGREYEGIKRTTFLISPEGTIRKIYENVKPSEHSQELLQELGK
jgi:thioredoxin-dependent peroxiredoxin